MMSIWHYPEAQGCAAGQRAGLGFRQIIFTDLNKLLLYSLEYNCNLVLKIQCVDARLSNCDAGGGNWCGATAYAAVINQAANSGGGE